MAAQTLTPTPVSQDDGARERYVLGIPERLHDLGQRVNNNEQERARLTAKVNALLKAGCKAQLTCDELAHEMGLRPSAVFSRTGGKQGTRENPYPKTKSAATIAKQTKIKERLQALRIQIEENRRQGAPLKSEAEGLILDRLHDVSQRIKANGQERARLSAEATALLKAGREAKLTCDVLANEVGFARTSVYNRTGKQGLQGASHPRAESAATAAKQVEVNAQLRALRADIEDNRRQRELLDIEANQLIGTAYGLGLTCRQVGPAMGMSNVTVYRRGGKRGLKPGRRPS